MRWLLLIFFSFVLLSPALGQPLVALHRADSDSIVYGASLQTLVEQARAGDTLYLPGAVLDLAGDLRINAPMHLVGAGCRTDTSDATGVTRLQGGRIIVASGATNGSLTGIWLEERLQFGTDSASSGASQYTITRCRFSDEIWLSYCGNDSCTTASETILLAENIFGGRIRGANGLRNVSLQNNIIETGVSHFAANSQLRLWSNSFLGQTDNGAYLQNVRFGNANYNIFLADNIVDTLSTSISFRVNLFGGVFTASNGNTESGSIEQQGIADSIFVSVPDFNYTFSEDHNYRLRASSAGKGADIFRRDLGHYGGRFTYKAGAKPFNPHIRTRDIAPYTETQNRLRIRIEIEAQEN